MNILDIDSPIKNQKLIANFCKNGINPTAVR